ncbi:MAG: DUF1571 domain-containing protein [Isosphaeraceae bacterium]
MSPAVAVVGLLVAPGAARSASPPTAEVPRLARVPSDLVLSARLPTSASAEEDAMRGQIAEANRRISECRERFEQVQDYTCIFFKRERVRGTLTSQHVMRMKARTQPMSVYLKYVQPKPGREGIFVAGKHRGRVLVHDVGIGKLLAGTLAVDPRSSFAMTDCRHPITEAGIGNLIHSIEDAWSKELSPANSVITIHTRARVGDRPCTMIESVHPDQELEFFYHMVKLYIDDELGLPIRFEAYDWPKRPGAAPELIEEYIFGSLRLNVGLQDIDFDPTNTQYAFGRF